MPYETQTTPFTGDTDVADFFTNVWVPFAETEVKWSGNQAPLRSPEVASPEGEFWISRVERAGSPGADVSPFTTKPPYVQYRTDDTGDHLHIFTSFGLGTGDSPIQEAYDQPNNPMNAPDAADYSISARVAQARCIIMNDLVGTFDKYWLFADTGGRYIHCVIKISSRHYRHFHIGLLTPLHPDLDADSFYVTGQFWDQLDPSGISSSQFSLTPTVNGEHDPYSANQLNPFWMNNTGNELDSGSKRVMQLGGSWFYMPGLAQNSPEIVWYKAFGSDALTWQDWSGDAVRKQIGDVNSANDAVIFGCCEVSGTPAGLGTVLFNCDRTFTSNAVPLVPIYVSANVLFASIPRQGVVAQIPDVFRINMKNIDAEQEIAVGSDTYTCFPLINKDSANVLAGEGYSGYEGLAYKKITDPVDV